MKYFRRKRVYGLFVFLAIGVSVWFFARTANADTFCVSDENELQAALDVTAINNEDDVIKIRQGTYYGNFTYNSTEAYSLTIKGGYNHPRCKKRVVDPDNTVLDAQDNEFVFMFNFNTPSGNGDLTLNGVTLRNGNWSQKGGGFFADTPGTVTIENCRISNNFGKLDGGGVYITNSKKIILRDNFIRYNVTGTAGGGVCLVGVYTVILANNVISHNVTDSHGGGIYISGTDDTAIVTLTNNEISHNSSGAGGGGIILAAKQAILISNSINHNTASRQGGGVAIWEDNATSTLINNVIINNQALQSGGGLHITTASTVVNNTISYNTSQNNGGGIYIRIDQDTDDANIYNNIILNNNAETGADLYINNDPDGDTNSNAIANLFNNDFDRTDGFFIKVEDSSVVYSDNLDTVDPQFDIDGYHLTGSSPCINKGNPLAPSLPLEDFEGDDRIVGAAPDIGADEYVETYIEVIIDIKPGNGPNSINLKSKGVVPVAVLTTDDFYASDIDPDTCLFADAEPKRWTMEDIDDDGDLDMLFHYRTQDLDLDENSTEATVTCELTDSTPIEGTNSIVIVPKPKEPKPPKYDLIITSYKDEGGEDKHWIEIDLLGENGEPVTGEIYWVYAPDGTELAHGVTDENGEARLSVVGSGTYHISFPDIDTEGWERV